MSSQNSPNQSMSNISSFEITQIIEQIKQEISVDAHGRGKASIKATARLAGVDDESIRKALKSSADLAPSKLAVELMEHGFSSADLNLWRTSGIPDIAIAIILEYYAFDAGRYCTQQARLVCRSFNAIGIRAWIQEKLGWTKPTNPNETTMTQTQLLAALAAQMASQEQQLFNHEERLASVEASSRMLEDRLDIIEVETIANIAELERFRDGHGHWYTIAGWCSLKGHKNKSLKELKDLGTKAAAMCRERGIAPQEMPDPRFGTVGLYPQSILIEVFGQHSTLPLPQQPQPLVTNLVQMTPRVTSYEKRRAVNRFLDSIENSPPDDPRRTWGSRKIGQYLGVSNRMVLYIKQEREGKRQPPKYAQGQ